MGVSPNGKKKSVSRLHSSMFHSSILNWEMQLTVTVTQIPNQWNEKILFLLFSEYAAEFHLNIA